MASQLNMCSIAMSWFQAPWVPARPPSAAGSSFWSEELLPWSGMGATPGTKNPSLFLGGTNRPTNRKWVEKNSSIWNTSYNIYCICILLYIYYYVYMYIYIIVCIYIYSIWIINNLKPHTKLDAHTSNPSHFSPFIVSHFWYPSCNAVCHTAQLT